MKKVLSVICGIGLCAGLAFGHGRGDILQKAGRPGQTVFYKGTVALSEIDFYPHDHKGRVKCASPVVEHIENSVFDWATFGRRIDINHRIQPHTHLPLETEPPSRETIETEFDVLITVASWYGFTDPVTAIVDLKEAYPTTCIGLIEPRKPNTCDTDLQTVGCPWQKYVDILRVVFHNGYVPRAYKLPGSGCENVAAEPEVEPVEENVAKAPYNPHPKRKLATTWGALKRR